MGLPQPDSLDVWDFLTGIASSSPRTEVPLSSTGNVSLAVGGILKPGSQGGLIVGEYKILMGDQKWQGRTSPDYPSSTHVEPTYPGGVVTLSCGSTGCLYNIICAYTGNPPFLNPGRHLRSDCLWFTADPNEEKDLATQLPAKLAELRARFLQIEETVYATPGMDPPSCESYKRVVDRNGGFWAPFNDTVSTQAIILGPIKRRNVFVKHCLRLQLPYVCV
jgi:hypothetical protein